MNDAHTLSLSPHTFDLSVGGMTCASCVGRVERALQQVPGVREASVNLATESARVVVDASDDVAIDARLRRAVRSAGYEPRSAEAAQAAADASPWEGLLPVAAGLALSAPLL